MSWKFAIFTYLVVWWISLFALLPLWVKPQENPAADQYAAAPEQTHLKRKLLINTGVSAVITLLIHLLLLSGWVPLRNVIQL